MKSSDSRRRFLGHMTTGLAGALASAPASVLGANERVRVGIIGPGDRGMQIVREAMGCPNIEMAAFADVYTARLEAAKQVAPGAKTFLDYRYLLDDKSVDAVLIATPQHLHCEHFVASIDAGKHVYQEKTMAFTVEHAKRMRSAYNKVKGKRTVQIGHQHVSSGYMEDTQRLLATGKMGRITALPMYMYRNTPHGKPQWSRPVYPDMTQENIIWNSFLGEAPKRDFDANRYVNWRFFWDYSGGNVYENFCHQLSIWYKALNLDIPESATMLGGVYLWKDGREVPDTMNVTLEQPEEILITWHSGFGNNHLGWGEDALGTDGTLARGQQVRYIPQKVNQPQATELVGQTRSVPRAHMQNFFDSIRENKEPNCPFEIGFRISIACRMAVDSYRTGRTLRWDREKEEIVG
jgi:predicted dehydrogenase